MHLMQFYTSACMLFAFTAANSHNNAIIPQHVKQVKQVAIIGAGAAGSSAAYHIRKFAAEDGVDVNITIFEKTAHIGGRTLTVNVYDDPLNPVELGASIFIEANHILRNATKNFNLGTQDPGSDEKGVLGIWDGDKFVYTQDSESSNWWNLAKLFWKYGTAPYYIYRLVQNTVATFLKLYQPPYFPFRSLSATAFELGLVKVTGVTGQQFLAESKLDGAFAHDIVQASTRVNYASNLPFIHGLGTMVAMAPEGAMAVTGGNWQIFSNMVTDSKAYVALNSTVSSISKESSSDPDSTSPKYTIKTKTTGTTSTINAEAHPVTFDDVVIAAPYQFSGISSNADVIPHPVDEIPYVTLHVTLFASPLRFSPEFFHLDPNATVPSSVLTTLGENDEAKSGPDAVGSAGFFSASLVKTVTSPKTGGKEYVYKIFSPDKVKPEFLSRLLGAEVPDTFTISTPSDAAADPVSWYHPTVFHPYPQKLPRVTFQDPVLGDGLYYTSGIESFISTMETSALMGMNVARLIVDDYLGISHNGEGEGEGEDSERENVREHVEGKQKILENSGRPFPDVDEL
ncbi:prenylcysteine oxidase [Hypoxylon fragiforme]|uniref:prenylcysteine oxidase n=1 Tax=Hypoxylon fragiforme TaxID=63214 RepID=UPI0020C63183|nr:prenylcysteine oxidase [Hypoxylon fragiforme]KAI2603346.1 prenylcysteine oxidase [Hypoxylon fragiforme]